MQVHIAFASLPITGRMPGMKIVNQFFRFPLEIREKLNSKRVFWFRVVCQILVTKRFFDMNG